MEKSLRVTLWAFENWAKKTEEKKKKKSQPVFIYFVLETSDIVAGIQYLRLWVSSLFTTVGTINCHLAWKGPDFPVNHFVPLKGLFESLSLLCQYESSCEIVLQW